MQVSGVYGIYIQLSMTRMSVSHHSVHLKTIKFFLSLGLWAGMYFCEVFIILPYLKNSLSGFKGFPNDLISSFGAYRTV